jgi:hypothetical protein
MRASAYSMQVSYDVDIEGTCHRFIFDRGGVLMFIFNVQTITRLKCSFATQQSAHCFAKS